MTDARLVSPSGAVTTTQRLSGDVVQFHVDIDTSAGMTAVHEALAAIETFAAVLRHQFGVSES